MRSWAYTLFSFSVPVHLWTFILQFSASGVCFIYTQPISFPDSDVTSVLCPVSWELLAPNYSERYQLMPYTINEWFCFHCLFHCHALEWQLGLLTAVSAVLKFAVFCQFGCFDSVYCEKREIRMWIYFFYISYFSHVLSCGEEFLNIQ